MSERNTFSPFWHRVRAMRPRLRPHVQIVRQHYRGRRWHVVRDPSSNQFYRLNPVAHEFVGLFDGTRTVEELWQLGLTRHGDDSLTQNDVIQLLTQLYSANLLSGDVSPETDQLLKRGRTRLGKKFQQQAIGLMYFKVRLFNPDLILSWLVPFFRPFINRWGFLLWMAWICAGLTQVVPRFSELTSGFGNTIAPSNWGWLMVVFVVVKLIHESGHGLICKRFGGQVPEFGAMMLVLLPAPYVDASSAWSFASKWQRIAVGAGGMIFELALAAGAAFVWARTPDGSLLHQIAYNVLFTASISTVIFNANPLMRFDGYYMLSDLLEVPNLMQRSQQMLKFLALRNLYDVRNANAPTGSVSEAFILIAYGIGAMIYRVVLFFSITLHVMGQMFAIGLLLAIWTASMWFLLPVGGFLHWLATGTQIADKRGRAVLVSIVLAAAIGGAVGLVPFPDWRRADGVVESAARTGIYFGTEGFVGSAHARAGDFVRMGDPVVTCVSPQLTASIALATAQLAEVRSKAASALNRDPAEAQIGADYVRTVEEQLVYLREQERRLVVRAPHDGRVVSIDPSILVGAFVKEGQPVCEIVDETSLRVTATLSQSEASWIYELPPDGYRVEYRLASDVRTSYRGIADAPLPAGDRELPHAGLGYAGGGTIEIDQTDQSGKVASRPFFKVHVHRADADGRAITGLLTDAPSGAGPGRPGEQVFLRFTLPDKPLALQWLDRIEKLIQGRAKV
ncbi:MAG: PqqD family peptide modification chaperone [Phycisphaerales bacterium]